MELDGKTLKVQPASFESAMELQEAVAEAIKGSKINLSGITGETVGNLMETDISQLSGPLESILGMAASLIVSKRVKAALFECCKTVLFGESKVDNDFFQVVENREFYYPIMVEVIKVNLGPFFKRLGLLLGGPGNLLQNFLRSKSS